jgi:membrane-associated phospholipid phosphatase
MSVRQTPFTPIRAALAVNAARDPARVAGGRGWLLGCALICGLAAVLLWSSAGYHTGFLALNSAFAGLPGWLWQWLTVLGDERVALALGLLLAYRHPRVFWTLICAAVVAIAYSRGLKPVVDAPRPPAVLTADAFRLLGEGHRSQSFPSGHSVTAAVVFGVLAYYAAQWRLALTFLALLAGLSRVAVGVHWPVDVMAGLGGGALAALAGVWLAQRSPWGILDEGVHLAFVALAAFGALGLLVDDGGYPAAALPLQALGAAALLLALIDYVLRPLWRWALGR